ncbi:MAG TPA: porin family protein [Flavobacteriales bacterium]|nr:hypothetical protein [Flavobacteriales bacterium]HRE73771.1 porin family protein [Flavobacteriales bacterium]HRE95670.1 porin family protein [Flavobacteriales bacterium]HRJ35067.1 porin family protein [Flavobacteriales bacterium]HRJ39688.1 porin family protein [Flavobacteriales bacterium]
MNTRLIITGLFALSAFTSILAQEPPAPPTPPAPPVPAGNEEKPDTTQFDLGNMRVIMYEKSKSEKVEISDKKEDKEDSDHDFGVWSGFGLGVNAFMTYDNKIGVPENANFLELDYARSMTVNFNFAEKRMRIIKDYLSINTGMGIQWNRYGIKNNYEIRYNSDSIYGVQNSQINYTKNVLKATYIQIPLLLEINTSKNADKSFHIAAGVVGGYKLGSRLKTRWEDEGRDFKSKSKGHYFFNPFQAYLHGSIGYGDVSLFVNYGLTRVFEKNKGPQVYPVTGGILFHF